MEDTNAINLDLGKPKKQLPRNLWKFLFVILLLLALIVGYMIGGSSNREKLADQKRGLEEQLDTIASLKKQIQELQKVAESETHSDLDEHKDGAEDYAEYDDYDNDSYPDDYLDEDNYYDDYDTDLYYGTEDEELVYITNTGEHYHRATCSSLSHSSYEVTLSEAIDAGYTPCKNCHPPTK